MYTSFNPGGIGHAFVKKRYIAPYRKKEEQETRFIGSTYKSNPYLNKEYIEYLESLGGDLGKAWREGEWDLFAGQVFAEFSYNKHVVRPFIPKQGDHYISMDWGYSEKSKFAAYLFCVVKMKSSGGENFQRVIVYKEWAGNLKEAEEWANIIYKDCQLMGVRPIKGWPDSAMLDRGSDGSISIGQRIMKKWTQLYGKPWVTLVRSEKHREARQAAVHSWLSIGPDGLPYLLLTESNPYLIESLPTLIYDENKVDDVDTDGDDHGYDGLSYGLIHIKFTPVTAGAYKMGGKDSVMVVKRRYNEKGEELAISPKEFSEMYK
jgi:phage terminase large subunit